MDKGREREKTNASYSFALRGVRAFFLRYQPICKRRDGAIKGFPFDERATATSTGSIVYETFTENVW